MNNRQLILIVGVTTLLALALAWVIERQQIRQFIYEFDQWYDERMRPHGSVEPPADDGA